MSNLKRFLALALVMVMVISGMALNVSAAKVVYTDVEDETLADRLDVLSQLKVVKGIGGGEFGGDQLVTRQQFALFTARISTGLPEYYEVDTSAPVAKPEAFTDVTDPTYFPAVDYCYKEGIIDGRGNGIFDPKAPVTLQEAVKMLVCSLNYTGLSYPQGYLVKANEPGVALLGEEAVLNGGYSFKGVAPNAELTRNQMAMLLWNYLLSWKQIPTMVINPTTGAYQLEPQPVAVLTLFGIIPTSGYITGVKGWTADIVANGKTYSGLGVKTDTSIFSPIYYDVCITTGYDTKINMGSTTTPDWVTIPGAVVKTTLKDTGLADWLEANEKEPLDLLGLKILAFEDRADRPEDLKINIPVRVIGSKVEVDIADCVGAVNDNSTVASLSLPLVALDVTVDKDVFKGNSENFYIFNKDAKLVAEAAKADNDNWAVDTAYEKFVKVVSYKANYRLECVFNGYYPDGSPEYFYIYRPFEAAVRVADDDGIRFTRVVEGKLEKKEEDKDFYFGINSDKDDNKGGVKVGNSVEKFYNGLTADDFKVGEAYLYTKYGSHLEIYAKLAKTADIETTYKVGSRVYFKNSTSLNFNGGLRAIGALDGSGKITVDPTTKYTLYSDESGTPLLARFIEATGAPKYVESEYGIVTAISDSRIITLRDPVTLERIGQGYLVTVVNAKTGKSSVVSVYEIDENSAELSTTDRNALIGKTIRLAVAHHDYYNVYTTAESDFVYTAIADKEYYGVTTVTANVSLVSNRVAITGAAPTKAATAYINSNTSIILTGYDKPVADPTRKIVTVRFTGNKAGIDALADVVVGAKLADLKEIIVVGLGTNPTGTAAYVFVNTNAVISTPATPANLGYAVVVSMDNDTQVTGFKFGLARTTDGKYIDVISESGKTFALGSFVAYTGDADKAIGEKTYKVVKELNDRLNITDEASFIASKANADTVLVAGENVKMYAGEVTFYGNGYGIIVNGHEFVNTGALNLKVVTMYEDKDAKKVIGYYTDGDNKATSQFMGVSDVQYAKALDAAVGKKIYGVVYSSGTGDSETVLFGTLIIDLGAADKGWAWRD